ncbi:IS110 family transposase [Kitasatospora sp. MBT63]|uniref:IS110 family transposase n=1 Tax=Kitasatospora sp. MBT63 TaxID=1444768 RepID=UPI00053B97D5|nr:IS110 family transposase [Kitasatospora sp. MBT63]
MGGGISSFWAGIDWSEHLNDVAVVDRTGAVVATARVEESPAGVRQVLQLLSGLRASHQHSRKAVPIAIETRHGLLVAALRQAGQPVVVISPTTVARYRGRANPGNSKKSDAQDAELLANILRTDAHLHRPLPANSGPAEALAVLTRAQLRSVYTRQHHVFQLRSQLRNVHPAALTAWAHLPGGILRGEARAVLALAPTSGHAARLTKRQIYNALATGGRTRLLDDHATRLRDLFRAPTLRQAVDIESALGQYVLTLLGLVNESVRAVNELTEQAIALFDQHPHASVYRSFPGVGGLTGARLLGEIGDDPTRFASAKGLRAYAGANPFTWASGTSRSVLHRRIAANKRLAAFGHHWAFSTLTRSPGCRAHYDRRRQQGERHTAALRNLYGRLLSCLYHCLQHGVDYQEEVAWPTPSTE